MTEPESIVSDENIIRVHGHANFGDMSPREVVNDGVRKYAVGFTGGHTQLSILLEHGLITKPRPGRYAANLTQKGQRYARAIWATHFRRADLPRPEDAARLRELEIQLSNMLQREHEMKTSIRELAASAKEELRAALADLKPIQNKTA